MTARELIAILQALPGDSEVLFDLGDEYISVETAEPSDPEGACILSAAADRYRYREETKDGVFQRFIG